MLRNKVLIRLALPLGCGAVSQGVAVKRRNPVVKAVEAAAPAVVHIRTEQLVNQRSNPLFGFGGSLFEEILGQFPAPPASTTRSLGSGVVVDPAGLVLTNAHVTARAEAPLQDNRRAHGYSQG